MKVLILTVGGSHQPLLKAIEQTKPDFIHFICSGDGAQPGSYRQIIGEGKVLHSTPPKVPSQLPDLPNVATLARLEASRFVVHAIDQPDNLDACFQKAAEVLDAVSQQTPEADILVDYTGGTKSMAAGLAAAALDHGRCKFQLVTGRRNDLRQVTDGTEYVRSVRSDDIYMRRTLSQCFGLLKRYDYSGAARLLEAATADHYSEKFQQQVQRTLDLCRAFDAWDRFEHQQAKNLLAIYKSDFSHHYAHVSLTVSGQGHGWELVEDLLLNAQRRAMQERYDDAVGRLYRALELTVQIWFQKRYQVDTSHVDLSRLPVHTHEDLKKFTRSHGKIQLGLRDAWDFLEKLPEDPLAPHYIPQKKELLTHLQTRNNSLFAHGTTPITRAQFEAFFAFCQSLLSACLEAALSALKISRRCPPLQQFPTSF